MRGYGALTEAECIAAAREPDWRVPEPGQVLVAPQGASLAAQVRQFDDDANLLAFEIGGEPAAQLRRAAREAAVAIGRAFARRFALWEGPAWTPRHLLVTGHQPLLAHPGILAKNLLVADLAARYPGSVGINVVVDYDTAAEVSASFPSRRGGRLSIERVALCSVGYGRPFSQVPPPGAQRWEAFCRQAAAALESLGPEGAPLVERLADLQAVVAEPVLGQARHLAEWLTALRHRWEAQALGDGACYLEVPMDELASTRPFRLFFAHIALSAARFAAVYNETLAEYRRRHRIRSRANPFPDLAVQGGRVELPFWLLTPGVRRRALHVERQGDGVLLSTADGPVTRLPAGSPAQLADALEQEGLAIRPRAVALTLFVRLLVADLFVHGIGGARYDRVTDRVAERFFGVRPPRYAVASASLPLGLSVGSPEVDAVALRRQLRDLRFNPQRFVGMLADDGAVGGEALRLAEEKRRLVTEIQQPGAPRRELTRQIEAVNERLYALLGPVRETLEARLRQAVQADAERQASLYREYPAFLYEPMRLRRMTETALAGLRRPDEAVS